MGQIRTLAAASATLGNHRSRIPLGLCRPPLLLRQGNWEWSAGTAEIKKFGGPTKAAKTAREGLGNVVQSLQAFGDGSKKHLQLGLVVDATAATPNVSIAGHGIP
jgi:hypothetical protein